MSKSKFQLCLLIFVAMCVPSYGEDVAVCAKIVKKSCKDLFGAWPGGQSCTGKTCFSDDFCAIGIASCKIATADSAHWNVDKYDYAEGATAENGGMLMSGSIDSMVCSIYGLCESECLVKPNGLKRCIDSSEVPYQGDTIKKLKKVLGDCPQSGPE
jgi:hypothetical protein